MPTTFTIILVQFNIVSLYYKNTKHSNERNDTLYLKKHILFLLLVYY